MNIRDGFIVKTEGEAKKEIEAICNDDVRLIPFNIVSEKMGYYLSKDGVVFGCERHNGFYLVNKLTISNRYKKGPVFKISMGHHRSKEIYLPEALYNTFIAEKYDENLELDYKDGNPYNYQLSNLMLKKKEVSKIFLSNINELSELYDQKFEYVVDFILRYSSNRIHVEDAEDIVSDSFIELCSKERECSLCINIWICISKLRMLDWKRKNDNVENFLYENGDEKVGVSPKIYETDISRFIKGKRNREYLKWWAAGETPTSVAEITNSTIQSTGASISRSIKNLKKILRKDVELWKK